MGLYVVVSTNPKPVQEYGPWDADTTPRQRDVPCSLKNSSLFQTAHEAIAVLRFHDNSGKRWSENLLKTTRRPFVCQEKNNRHANYNQS